MSEVPLQTQRTIDVTKLTLEDVAKLNTILHKLKQNITPANEARYNSIYKILVAHAQYKKSQQSQSQQSQTKEVRVFRMITMNSIEEHILARANFKMGLDHKIIEAGMFNKRSNAKQRKTMLQELLSMDKESKKRNKTLPTDEEINQLISRSDEEYELFQQMDIDRAERAKARWRAAGNKGDPPPRLMTLREVPGWLKDEAKPVAKEELGRGQRKRSTIDYHDDLTDMQFDKMVEEGGDPALVKKWRTENRKRRDAEQKALEAEMAEAAAAAPPPVKRKRGRPRKNPAEPAKKRRASTSTSKKRKSTETRKRKRSTKDTDGTPALTISEKADRLWGEVRKSHDSTGRQRSSIFLHLPSKDEYPDYYKVIKKPIDMTMIKRKIDEDKYKTLAAAKRDFLLMFKNAQRYNLEESEIYQDALFLQDLVVLTAKELQTTRAKRRKRSAS
eukprot:TRINITY_DN135_c0_g1_i2.p1 TRINITY_DN135_c0_g1~~TRINITY_DN135_c0_g1_i2.p1  ORF type:complete len:445 (+),score=87.05 TRINITY_DN135_c0_g1_i2:94-1428(+)